MNIVMDLGWIITFAADASMTPQISVAIEGGSGTTVPDLSIEVDDLLWLGEEPAGPDELKALLTPFPSEEMTCWPVSSRVGNVRNNDASLIEPIAA
jgi:hypothetical protein